MPDLSSYINFSVEFDLTGANPVMILTDTSNYPGGVETGITGFFSVTSPDGGVDAGSWSSLDVTYSGGQLTPKNQTLRKASDGNVQQGVYTVVYNATHASYAPTTLSRTFTFSFTAPALDLEQNVDVFTPEITCTDSTVYTVSNYNAPTITRSWSAVGASVGTVTSSTASVDITDGQYYDDDYTVTFTVDLSYQHSSYAYLSVTEQLTETLTFSADTPEPCSTITSYLDDLKAELDAADVCSYNYKDLKAKYEYASSLLNHIRSAAAAGDFTNLSGYVSEYIRVCNNYVTPAYVNTGDPILPYDTSCFSGGSTVTTLTITYNGSSSASYTNASFANKTILLFVREGLIITPGTYSLSSTTVSFTNGDQFEDGVTYTFILKA